MYACTHACMHVSMYAHVYTYSICIYAECAECMYVCTDGWIDMSVCLQTHRHPDAYLCTRVLYVMFVHI